MNEVCISPTEKARNAMTRVLHALSPTGKDGAVAASLGWSTTKMSNVKNERLVEGLMLISALGFKLVNEDKVCVSREELHMLRLTYARAVQNEELSRSLFGEGE